MSMITWQNETARFTNRVAGVAIHNGRVLLHRAESDDFWVMPGGRAELMESAADSLRREMREELEVDVEVVRLLWLAENFFHHEGAAHHELGLYFLMEMPAEWRYLNQDAPFRGYEGQIPLVFQWIPLSQIGELKVYPQFLQDGLQDTPASMQHVVNLG